MDLPPPENESGNGAAVPATPCPGTATWTRIQATAGAAADGRFHEHLSGCPACLRRLEAIAAEWSRDDLVAVRASAVAPGSDALVERLLENPPQGDPAPPHPSIDGLDDLVEVGRGGMGIVYRAHDSRLDRTVALKVLSAAHTLSAEARQRAEREARSLARITHPNIVRIISVTNANGLPAIVMEWIDGESLDARGRRGVFNVVEAVRIVRDLAGAVEAMRAKGVVHRDIKPANVLVAAAPGGGPGEPKLIDFGLALPDDDPGRTVTRASITVGTPAFMAPEQTGIDPALGPVGPATDIHGLGALLYWLLSGKVPYEGRTTAAILKRAADGHVTPISSLIPRLPHDVATIVATCLERHPERRYGSARALADDLSRFLDGRPIIARRAGACERAIKWARRRPVTMSVIVCVAIAATSVIAGVAYHVRSLERSSAALSAKQDQAIAAAALARQSFERLTDSSAERFLARGSALDAADRDHLRQLRDRYREWPLEPDEVASLHFRASGLFRLATLFDTLHWNEDAIQAGRECRASLDMLEARGHATREESARRYLLERMERAFLAGTGRLDEAIETTRAGVARLEAKVAADPALERHLAVALADLGNLKGKAGHLTEARDEQERALAIFDRLVAAFSSDAELARISLTVLYNAAINPAFAGDPTARRALVTTLVDRATDGMERFQTEPAQFGRGLLLGLSLLADADLREARPEEALEKVRRRAEAARRLAEVSPHRQLFLDEWIGASVQAFECLQALGRPGDARAALDEADALATKSVAEEPAVIQRTWVLVQVLLAKVTMEEVLGRRAEAIAVRRRLLAAILPWVKDDESPEPFPIKVADVRGSIERLEAEERAATAAE